MNKRIRIAKPAELPNIAILDRRVNATPWNMLQYEECLANNKQKIYVLEINQHICGFLVVSIIFDEVEILQMAIAAEYQNQKLAGYLLNTVLTQLDEKYLIGKVFLEVAENNERAIAVYKRLGFTVIATRKDYYTINNLKFDALVMMLNYAKL